MVFVPLLAASLLAAASMQPSVPMHATHVHAQDNAVAVPSAPGATPGVPAPPAVGDSAPDFTYQSHDYLWLNLHHMLNQGSVLLVFGASDAQLRALERDRDDLLRTGVVPVAVVCQREADVWNTVRRCDLSFSLLADPHASIAEQFGAVDAGTRKPKASWFVIGASGRVRGAGQGMPASNDWLALAHAALGQSDIALTGTR